MDYETAKKLMSTYDRMGAVLNEADSVIRTLSAEERSAYLPALTGLVADIWLKLQRPIVQQYEDLDPDAEYFKNKTKPDQ
ncbi:hypothetical protein GTP58_08930 [Duganella sp. CY15W]|uniref:hypothetical protein n=1 Tax=Duganella sp. CY15W TaxID=2692172 RepID=UPI00136D3C6C|nr:hypothetical protein [Duganella sp. CY15W]MYM28448.1 hypothetical protein [Duganella sp. CY15W]